MKAGEFGNWILTKAEEHNWKFEKRPTRYPWANEEARKWFKWWSLYTFIVLLLMGFWTVSAVIIWSIISGWFIISAITIWYAVTDKIKCPKCGHKMVIKYHYCPKCGEKLQEVHIDRKHPPSSKKDKVVYPPPEWWGDEDDELFEDFFELTEEEEDEE